MKWDEKSGREKGKNETHQTNRICVDLFFVLDVCFLFIFLTLFPVPVSFGVQVFGESNLAALTPCEMEQIARQIAYPASGYELHVS